MNIIPEAKDNPSNAKRTKSLPSAPIDLPDGPPLTYPIEYMALKIITAKPRAAAGMGKYIPAQKTQTSVDGANST